MKEVGSPKLLFENLDLTPIQLILWTGLHTQGPGRPVEYNPVWDLRALMLRQLVQIPYVKDLVKRLRREPYIRQACGYGGRAPCEAHFTQMKKRVGPEGFRTIEAWLRREALRLRRSQPLSAIGARALCCSKMQIIRTNIHKTYKLKAQTQQRLSTSGLIKVLIPTPVKWLIIARAILKRGWGNVSRTLS